MASVQLIYSGEFLIASQLPPNRRITARIHAVAVETLGSGQDQAQKLALELASADGRPWPRRVILNRTNAAILAKAFGDDTDNWTGNALEIWQEQVSFRGSIVPGVRVAPVLQPPSRQQPPRQPQAQTARGNGAVASTAIPETSLSDALEDEIPF